MASLFQKSEGNPNPVVLMDFHFGNTITGLFFASNKYLFSISEEGTVCITHISSSIIRDHFEQLEEFKSKVTPIQKKRFDRQIKDIQKDYKNKRRASFTSYTNNMWLLVKINYTQRFKDLSPFGINKILEVKDVETLRGQNKQEENKIDLAKLRLKKLREYAFVGEDNVVFLLSLKTMQIQKLLSCDSHAIGIYYDSVNNYYYVLTKELNILYFNRVTMTLERRGDFEDASYILCLDDIIQSIFHDNEIFQSKDLTDVSINDYETFDKICQKRNLYMEYGKHKTLDYLNLSLNMPINYNDMSLYSKKYTKALHDFLRTKPNLKEIQADEQKRKKMLITLNSIIYLNNHLYNSDANERDFKQSGVSFIKAHIGTKSMRGNNQQIMIVNLKMVIKNIRRKFMNEINLVFEDEDPDDNIEFTSPTSSVDHINLKKNLSGFNNNLNEEYISPSKHSKYFNENEFEEHKTSHNMIHDAHSPKLKRRESKVESINSHVGKDLHDEDRWLWPLTLMSLFHPFRLSDPLDIDLENLFKLSLPFLDIRIGIQGASESFTFVIAKNKPKKPKYRSLLSISGEKFFNDMNWKVSQYLSTTISTGLLSMLVSVIERNEKQISEIINNWLYILLIIMKVPKTKNLSLSFISKLLLKEEFNINSTARDVVLRFFFYNMDINKEQGLLDEWSALLMDTYRLLKDNNKYIRGSLAEPNGAPEIDINLYKDNFSLTKYFGELEIRGLIIISYYSLNYVQYVDPKIARRWSKLIIMLTRITFSQAKKNRSYIHLLSILFQLLSTGIRIYHMTYENEEMLDDIMKLLLHAYNDYNPTGQAEHSNIKLNDFNFFLIKVTNPELSLKRVAAKTLLEIGENFPNKFLSFIQKEAHTLQESHEFQKAILEILKQYIKFYGISLEPFLIQITQIVLKCLDPHDIPLRKNSLVDVTIILGILVKKFPMVDFHHDSQRLAVGTNIGPIAIYDVRTSAKWRVLEGHTGKITCLKFNTSGDYLISYSATDLSLRLWKVGNTGFFSGIMGVTAKCAKSIKLNPVPPKKVRNSKHLENIFELMSARMSMSKISFESSLQPEKEDEYSILNCSLSFIGNKKEKEVILVREDQSSETYKVR